MKLCVYILLTIILLFLSLLDSPKGEKKVVPEAVDIHESVVGDGDDPVKVENEISPSPFNPGRHIRGPIISSMIEPADNVE